MFCLLDSGGCEDEWCWCWCCQSRHGGLWRGGVRVDKRYSTWPKYVSETDNRQGQSDSKMTVKSWAILGGVYLQLECHSQYVANLMAKQLCMQGTTARCGSSKSGRGSSVLLNILELWLWNEDFMQRPQVVSSTDICFARPFRHCRVNAFWISSFLCKEHGRFSSVTNLNSNCWNGNQVFVPMFGWIQEDAKMNDADADAAKADTEACGEVRVDKHYSTWPKYVSETDNRHGQSDSKMTMKSWAILGGVYLQLECHSQYVANLMAKQLCMQGTTARCGSSKSGRGSSVLLNILELWLWNEDFMQRPQVVSSTDICFARPFASLQSQCILDFIFFV